MGAGWLWKSDLFIPSTVVFIVGYDDACQRLIFVVKQGEIREVFFATGGFNVHLYTLGCNLENNKVGKH